MKTKAKILLSIIISFSIFLLITISISFKYESTIEHVKNNNCDFKSSFGHSWVTMPGVPYTSLSVIDSWIIKLQLSAQSHRKYAIAVSKITFSAYSPDKKSWIVISRENSDTKLDARGSGQYGAILNVPAAIMLYKDVKVEVTVLFEQDGATSEEKLTFNHRIFLDKNYGNIVVEYISGV